VKDPGGAHGAEVLHHAVEGRLQERVRAVGPDRLSLDVIEDLFPMRNEEDDEPDQKDRGSAGEDGNDRPKAAVSQKEEDQEPREEPDGVELSEEDGRDSHRAGESPSPRAPSHRESARDHEEQRDAVLRGRDPGEHDVPVRDRAEGCREARRERSRTPAQEQHDDGQSCGSKGAGQELRRQPTHPQKLEREPRQALHEGIDVAKGAVLEVPVAEENRVAGRDRIDGGVREDPARPGETGGGIRQGPDPPEQQRHRERAGENGAAGENEGEALEDSHSERAGVGIVRDVREVGAEVAGSRSRGQGVGHPPPLATPGNGA
jgi:hypothetical protein